MDSKVLEILDLKKWKFGRSNIFKFYKRILQKFCDMNGSKRMTFLTEDVAL